MSIRFSKYINITSGVIAQGGVPDRSLCGRLFTDNNLVPPQTVITFTTLTDVGNYFGTTSAEYLRAAVYFGFVSKQIKSASQIEFARWVDVAVAPMIFGTTAAKLLATFNAITAGGFTISLGGVPLALTGINLSAAANLAAVATTIQTAIRTGTGINFTGATVTYDALTNRFNFVGGATGAAAITVTDGAQGVAAALGWVPQLSSGTFTTATGAIWANGAAIENPDASFNTSVATLDNFGSFSFIPALTLSQATAIANASNAFNETYLFCLPIAAANAATWFAAMGAIGGVAPTLSPIATEYPELDPMMILAATDYNSRNAAQNYMYQVFSNQTPSVTDNASSDAYDAQNINYYGQTMKNGRAINFYQRGVMWGGQTDAKDIGIYANEIWLKAAMGGALMNVLLALTQLPANADGRGFLMANSQPVINLALRNGTISVGKPLNATQQTAISMATGDSKAWYQVQNTGFWIDWVIEPFTDTDGATRYRARYTLVYSKDDVIRTIIGTHALV